LFCDRLEVVTSVVVPYWASSTRFAWMFVKVGIDVSAQILDRAVRDFVGVWVEPCIAVAELVGVPLKP